MARLRCIVLLALTAPLTLAACQREPERDPFAVPGANRLQIQALTFSEAEEWVRTTRAGQAMVQVEDPCGGPAGPTGMSYAWLNAEVIAAGHDRDLACAMAQRGYRPPSLPDRPMTPEERAAMDTRGAVLDLRLRLLEQGNAEQVRFINALPADDQPTQSAR